MFPVCPFPGGAIIAAVTGIKKNRESTDEALLAEERSTLFSKPKSKIVTEVDDDKISINFEIVKDIDWARAAWAMVKVCEEKGQYDNLVKMMEDDTIVKERNTSHGEEKKDE